MTNTPTAPSNWKIAGEITLVVLKLATSPLLWIALIIGYAVISGIIAVLLNSLGWHGDAATTTAFVLGAFGTVGACIGAVMKIWNDA
jgi:hypothetical protein